jgi:hypothetical protein
MRVSDIRDDGVAAAFRFGGDTAQLILAPASDYDSVVVAGKLQCHGTTYSGTPTGD